MLNLSLIRAQMAKLGLSQSDLADICEVSREAVSNWLSGEAYPRPRYLRKLANALMASVEMLTISAPTGASEVVWLSAQGIVRPNSPLHHTYRNIGEDFAGQLRALRAYLPTEMFSKRHLLRVDTSPEFLGYVAETVSWTHGTGIASVELERLLMLHKKFGSVLVPVTWEHTGWEHSGAVVSLTETNQFFVYVDMHNSAAGLNRTLAEALGLCYAWTAPPSARQAFAIAFADQLGVTCADVEQGTPVFELYSRNAKDLIEVAETLFDTPIYRALRYWQVDEGGRNPAFLSAVLGLPATDAYHLSVALNFASMPPP